jgi:hypothetical protein
LEEDVKPGSYLNFVNRHHKTFRFLNLFTFALLSGAIFLICSGLLYIKKEYSRPVVRAKTVRVDKLNTSETGKDFQVFFSYVSGSKTFYGNEYRRFYMRPNVPFHIRINPEIPSQYISVEQLRKNFIKKISFIVAISVFLFFSFFFNSLPYWKSKRLRHP